MSLVEYLPHDHAVRSASTTELPDLAARITEALSAAFRPDADKRALERLSVRLKEARSAATAAREIADLVHRVAVASAACAAELERLKADLLAHVVRQMELELREEELTLTRGTLAARIQDEAVLAQLRRDVERAKLTAELHAVQPPAAPSPQPHRELPSATPLLDAEWRLIVRKEAEAQARRIVEEVHAGYVPTGVLYPYHAFAGCVFVTAQLEGASVADAAQRTREVVLDRITARQPILPGEQERYQTQYETLQKRLDTLAGSRQTATILSAMQRMGASGVPSNGNGGGAL